MQFSVKFGFRIIFLIGIIFLFLSVFLDWYTYIAFDDQKNLVVSWSYHLFLDWKSILPSNTYYNENYKPTDSSIPILVNVVLIALLMISAFSVLFEDVEKKENLLKLYRYAYINLCLLFLIGFYIVLFPVIYLIPNNLYYPWLFYIDIEKQLTFFYFIGPGYIFQVIGFIFTFPYCVFYYQTIMKFERARQQPQKLITNYINEIKEPLDLDKFIAEEELKQELPSKSQHSDIEKIYSQFMEKRRIK